MPPQILVAITFFESKAELPVSEARRIDNFIQKMISNPANPGIGLERLTDGADANMWSARVSQDLRAILHHDGNRYTLLHVNHHDAAYDWAKRRRIRPHPTTGAIQIVVLPEVQDVTQPTPSTPSLECQDPNLNFGRFTTEYLLRLGVPEEWVPVVQRVRSESDFWPIHAKLPEEPAELLYALALGEAVTPPKCIAPEAGVQANPDNLRRLHVVSGSEELQALLTQPFEAWRLYLHPSQRYLTEGDFHGPVKVTGAAGTGKTVVAMHRARHLSRQGKRVLLTTFSKRLSQDIEKRVGDLCSLEERNRIRVSTVHSQALAVLRKVQPGVQGRNSDFTRKTLEETLPEHLMGFAKQFLFEEWQYLVDQQGMASLEEYTEAPRIGRGTPLGPGDRERVWSLFAPAVEELLDADLLPWSFVCRRAREAIESERIEKPFDAVVIDEVQDLNAQEIRFLAALALQVPNSLMLIGDAGQRIYPGGFSLRSLGIETRGRSRTLQINYRTTREIARAASHLRGKAVDNLEEGEETTPNQDLLSGDAPILKGFQRYEEEQQFVGSEIARLIDGGTAPAQIALFSRTKRKRWWFEQELRQRGIPFVMPDQPKQEGTGNDVFVSTMHGAKGLEFRYVFIVGCQQGDVPAKVAMDMAADRAEKDAVFQREKNLLYVSMTRAREQLYITWTGRRSEFLRELASD